MVISALSHSLGFDLESTAAEPTSATNRTSAAAAAASSTSAAAATTAASGTSAAKQHPDQWNCGGWRDRRWRDWGRPPAQPGLQPQPGASKQETTPWAFRHEFRRACHAFRLSSMSLFSRSLYRLWFLFKDWGEMCNATRGWLVLELDCFYGPCSIYEHECVWMKAHIPA